MSCGIGANWMKFKYAQWVLFLIVAIGTLVALIGFDLRGQQGIMTLFAGLSASLFVFCFVPYGRKYYLSELMIIMFAFSVVMTFYANTLQIKFSASTTWDSVLIWSYVIVAFAAPFVTYGILEGRRPYAERNSTLEAEEWKEQPSNRVQTALIQTTILFLGGVLFFLAFLFHPTCCLCWPFVLCFGLSFMTLGEYNKAKQDERTKRLSSNGNHVLELDGSGKKLDATDSSIASNQTED